MVPNEALQTENEANHEASHIMDKKILHHQLELMNRYLASSCTSDMKHYSFCTILLTHRLFVEYQ